MRRRVITSHYGGWVDPAECFLALSGGDEPVFWLDSGKLATTGMSFLGAGSRTVSGVSKSLCELPSGVSTHESIFEFLRRELAQRVDSDEDGSSFPLGWVGWLGYELHEETLNTELDRASRYPDAAFLFAERVIAFDHARRTVTLAALGDSWAGELAAWNEEMVRMLSLCGRDEVEVVRAPVFRSHDRDAFAASAHSEWAYTDGEYLAMIDECQRSIRAGDAYQLCLTTEVTLDMRPDPVSTYLRLRELSPSHHGGFLRIGEVNLLSSSPEKFLSVTPRGEVESKPIKGTRKRGKTPEADGALRSELLASEKERAENLMIVDLVRNDLSRVCEVGSVSVPVLLEVESYAQVHQLVSTVRGTLKHGADAIDAVVACFPAGSMTGAPKLSAVRLLDALERRARGIYSGAWGYFGLDGSIDLAMTIRSIVVDGHGVSIGTGGGITALSAPEEELEETKIKATALLHALGLITL